VCPSGTHNLSRLQEGSGLAAPEPGKENPHKETSDLNKRGGGGGHGDGLQKKRKTPRPESNTTREEKSLRIEVRKEGIKATLNEDGWNNHQRVPNSSGKFYRAL